MKKTSLLCIVLAMGLSPWCQAASSHSRQAQVQSEQQDEAPAATSDDDMTGKIGVGVEVIPGATSYVNAITGTYWLKNSLALDAMLGAGNGSFYNDGTTSTLAPVDDSDSNVYLGIQGRYDLARPTPNLHLQGIARLSYGDLSLTHTTDGNAVTTGGSTLGVFVGAGFEGFIPYWHAVSIEVNTGLHLESSSASYSGHNVTNSLSESAFYLGGGSGLLPVDLAVHYYF